MLFSEIQIMISVLCQISLLLMFSNYSFATNVIQCSLIMKIFISIVISFLLSVPISAQVEVTKSERIVKQNGQSYYLHTVKNGQTLYSISKAYSVSISDITKANGITTNSISTGQELRIPTGNASENKSEFIWHKVKSGETVYSISQKYNISEEDIYSYNSSAVYGISVGTVLKIPNTARQNSDFADAEFYYHTIVSGNTLFSISQQYGVSIDQIKSMNPSVNSGLSAGQVLKIPKVNYDGTERIPVSNTLSPDLNNLGFDPLYFEEQGVTPCNRYIFDKNYTYEIAVILPLFIENNLWVMGKHTSDDDKMFYKNSQRFVEMYEGILLALQRLKQEGVSMNVHVYDTENSAVKTNEIINQVDFSKLDLIIGPVYTENFRLIAHHAKKHKVNIISPLANNPELTENNPFVFNVMPSEDMRARKSAEFLSRLYDSCVVIVHGGTAEERKKIELYKQKLSKSFSWNPNVKEVIVKTINYNVGGSKELEKSLSKGYTNLIMIPSESEVFVTKVVEFLGTRTKDYDIKLLGLPEWEYFQNINLKHLTNEQFHYATPAYVNYENWRVKSFVSQYRETYNTEPSVYAFQGYDIMYYFGSALKTYGRHFQFCISPFDKSPNPKGLVMNFDFSRTGKSNGYSNNGLFILKYSKDYQLIEAGK